MDEKGEDYKGTVITRSLVLIYTQSSGERGEPGLEM